MREGEEQTSLAERRRDEELERKSIDLLDRMQLESLVLWEDEQAIASTEGTMMSIRYVIGYHGGPLQIAGVGCRGVISRFGFWEDDLPAQTGFADPVLSMSGLI